MAKHMICDTPYGPAMDFTCHLGTKNFLSNNSTNLRLFSICNHLLNTGLVDIDFGDLETCSLVIFVL